MAKNFTLEDIAKFIGVSASTVSRVINDKEGISEKTRRRVLEAISKYNYVPNISAKSLATSQTKTIVLIGKKRLSKLVSVDYQHRCYMGIEEELAKQGYHALSISITDEEILNPDKIHLIKEKRADGFIIRGPSIKPSFILSLKSMGLPVVLFGNKLRETKIDSIVCNNKEGAYQVTKHLIEHGHREILFLSGPREWPSNFERREGYKLAITEAGFEPKILFMPDTTIENGKMYIKYGLEKYPKITAVVAVNDITAIGVMEGAREMGKRLPEDLAITGFDDIAWASLSYPPLTTMHVYLEEMGKLAAYRLLELIKDTNTPPAQITVATKLIIRKSCGC